MAAQQNRGLLIIGAVIAIALVVIALVLARTAFFPPLTSAQQTATARSVFQTIDAGLK